MSAHWSGSNNSARNIGAKLAYGKSAPYTRLWNSQVWTPSPEGLEPRAASVMRLPSVMECQYHSAYCVSPFEWTGANAGTE